STSASRNGLRRCHSLSASRTTSLVEAYSPLATAPFTTSSSSGGSATLTFSTLAIWKLLEGDSSNNSYRLQGQQDHGVNRASDSRSTGPTSGRGEISTVSVEALSGKGVKTALPSMRTFPSQTRRSAKGYSLCSAASTRAARLVSSSPTAIGTTACAMIGPSSVSAVTKCTVQPWMRIPASSARRWESSPLNKGRREGWMLIILPSHWATNSALSSRI